MKPEAYSVEHSTRSSPTPESSTGSTLSRLLERKDDATYVVAAYGRGAVWVYSLEANRSLSAQIGWRQFDAKAVFLSEAESTAFLVDLYRRRPTYSRSVMRAIRVKIESEEDVRTVAS